MSSFFHDFTGNFAESGAMGVPVTNGAGDVGTVSLAWQRTSRYDDPTRIILCFIGAWARPANSHSAFHLRANASVHRWKEKIEHA